MSGRIPQSFIDDLLARVDIVDLIDSRVPLKKSGSNNYVARCPFHSEKTPSFTVSRNKQFYYCFGCGASGSAIGFLMDFNHLGFVEAVEDLARFAGVDVPREVAGNERPIEVREDLNALYDLQQRAAHFYAEQLRSNSEGRKAVAYLKARGVSGAVARDFMLGYAPKERALLEKRFDTKLLLAAGLLGQNEDGRKYDRFRNRVMFPIRDRRGRVVGFGGRVLDDSLPKYLNSPETPVFQKGREVYGLCELLQANSRPERILIVEGYMDVIALAQCGIHYAVATLGTATSEAHLELLFRISSELVLCFDGDAAGMQAAWRATESALSGLRDGRQIRIMLLPEGTDPDSLVREEGAERFASRILASQTLSDYFFGRMTENLNLTSIEGRSSLVKKARPYLNKLPNGVFREMMFARLEEVARIGTLDVSENGTKLYSKSRRQDIRKRDKPSSARTAIACLLQNPSLAQSPQLSTLDWEGLESPGLELLGKILNKMKSVPGMTLGGLIEVYRGCPEEKQIKALGRVPVLVSEDKMEPEFIGAIKRLIAQAREEKLALLIAKEKDRGLDDSERRAMIDLIKMLALKKR
ncbi:MAG: DNA primase [Gammaproteobacteria bacterium]